MQLALTPSRPQKLAVYRVNAASAALAAEYPGGLSEVVPSYNCGRGATAEYIVAILIIEPKPCDFIRAPRICVVVTAHITPHCRLRCHWSNDEVLKRARGCIESRLRPEFVRVVDQNVDTSFSLGYLGAYSPQSFVIVHIDLVDNHFIGAELFRPFLTLLQNTVAATECNDPCSVRQERMDECPAKKSGSTSKHYRLSLRA